MSCIYKYKDKDYTKDEFYSLVRTTMVQPRTVQKYEKVLFPTGDTASKVEGHTTLEEFKKQKEDRIKELEDSKPRLEKGKDEYYIWYKDNITDEEFAERYKTKEEAESSINENLKNIDTEINQLKQELERVEKEGFGALKPIYKFYEETVRNILNKTYGKENINTIIDDYGNNWFELDLSKVVDTHIYFSKRIDKNSNQSNTSTQYSLRDTKELSKPEQLFQRRIDRLTKQVALEKDTKKKIKLQQELNYTTEQYIRSQQEGFKDSTYKDFGEHTLDLAEARINSLKNGNTTDLNADLEYINDVLDVWYGFPGLTDRTIELRNSIKDLSNELLVKNINESYNSKEPITLEDIKSQNKDISTLKYWTGALLDLPNYIAHSIGYIIRASQNEIERKTNTIFSEIDSKIKEITKKSGKDIQSIYNEIIETNDLLDTKTLIKEEKLANKSEEAKEFYKFYQSKLEELMKITPTLTRRNNKGELETFNLSKYFIPNVYKSDLKSTLKQYNPIKERRVGDVTKDIEQKADIISLDYIKKIPSKDKSDDLGNSLFLFAKSIYNYDEMSKTLPKVRLLQREIENTSYIQGSDPNTTKTGKDSNLYKITEAFIKAQVKGEYKQKQGRNIVTSTKKDENGNTIESYIDVTGTVDNMLKWNSLKTIGLSLVGASSNIGFGKLSNFMEAIGGRFFNRTHLRQAERIFWAQTFKEDSVLNKELLSKYNILQESTDYEQSENLKTGKYKKISGEKIMEWMYAPQKYGEKWIQSSTLLAVMLYDGYMNEKGELTEKFNDATQAEKEKLFGKITGINNKLHGRYSPKEAAAMQQHVFYRAITQFRKWIPAAIEARFDEKHYDPRLGVEVEGRYRTFSREVLLKLVKGDITNAFYNLFMPLINAKEALESGKLSESDIYNMRKMLIDSVLAIATLVLYSIGTGDDPEDKKRRKEAWFKSTMLLLNRVSGDLTFFYSPDQINNLTKNAIPMSKLVDDLLKIGPEIPNAFDSKKNKFKSGNSKGQYRLPKRIMSVIPGSKAPYDLIKIFNKQALDEVK